MLGKELHRTGPFRSPGIIRAGVKASAHARMLDSALDFSSRTYGQWLEELSLHGIDGCGQQECSVEACCASIGQTLMTLTSAMTNAHARKYFINKLRRSSSRFDPSFVTEHFGALYWPFRPRTPVTLDRSTARPRPVRLLIADPIPGALLALAGSSR